MKMRKKNDTAVYSTGTKVIRFLVVLLMSFVAFLTLYPIFYVVLGAFKKNQELLTGGINIFPSEWIVQNFIDAWNSANFAVYTGNSIFLALSVMILTLVVTSMAGYVFARKNFRGKELIYGLFVAFMFVNVGSVTLRPLFELAVKIHMNTSLWSVVFISAGTAQATYIFLIRGYVRIRKGQLKKAAQELPAGSMPLADMEAWEIPTLLDEPKPLHFLWFMIQYVIGVLMKMPFYWHLIYWFFFADVFLCFFCQYLDGMHGFIRDHQKIANLPVETMQRTGKLILKIAVLLLVLFVLPSALYGKDPIAEAIAGYEPKELESDLTIETPEAEAPQGMEQADLSDMLGDKEYKPMPQWIQNLFTAVMYLVMVAVGIAVLRAIYQSVKNAGKAFSEDEEDEVLFLHQGNDERENLPWRREKKEGYLSPNMRIRRKYKKTIKKAGKYQPTGAETPAELEERNELSGDGMRRLHDGYEKARYSREGCTKEEAEALRN